MKLNTKVEDIHTKEVWYVSGKPNPWSNHVYVRRPWQGEGVKTTLISMKLLRAVL